MPCVVFLLSFPETIVGYVGELLRSGGGLAHAVQLNKESTEFASASRFPQLGWVPSYEGTLDCITSRPFSSPVGVSTFDVNPIIVVLFVHVFVRVGTRQLVETYKMSFN